MVKEPDFLGTVEMQAQATLPNPIPAKPFALKTLGKNGDEERAKHAPSEK